MYKVNVQELYFSSTSTILQTKKNLKQIEKIVCNNFYTSEIQKQIWEIDF